MAYSESPNVALLLSRITEVENKHSSLKNAFENHEKWSSERIKKHDKDLYEGNGLPSITNRLSSVEMIAGMAKFVAATACVNTIMLVVFLINYYVGHGGGK